MGIRATTPIRWLADIDVSALDSGSLTVFNNFTVADVGFGNSTQSDVIDGDGFTINGVDLENDDSSDSVVGNSRKREGSGYRNRWWSPTRIAVTFSIALSLSNLATLTITQQRSYSLFRSSYLESWTMILFRMLILPIKALDNAFRVCHSYSLTSLALCNTC